MLFKMTSWIRQIFLPMFGLLIYLHFGSCFCLRSHTYFSISASHIGRSNGDVASTAHEQHKDIQYHFARLQMSLLSTPRKKFNDDVSSDVLKEEQTRATSTSWSRFALFSIVGLLYWYLMVFGAAAQMNGLPVPDFIPMTPGWPATDADLAPVLEDSYHFFYLSELLHNDAAPYVIPPRLAVFNGVEAWIFAMLPALWTDKRRRIPRPILLVSWLLLGINLTNAFLAPYLALTEIRSSSDGFDEQSLQVEESPDSLLTTAFPRLFGAIAATVGGYALYQSIVVATGADWSEFFELVKTDRSYLAFCIDPILFGIFQPLILGRVKNSTEPIDYVPFIGLIVWLFVVDVDAESTKEAKL